MASKISIAVSACLLGQPVRYDGDNARNPYITQTLGKLFNLEPVCPELGIGLGVPRLPIQLVQMGTDVRVRGIEYAGHDFTDDLIEYAEKWMQSVSQISGLILKSKSPSCGVHSTKLYNPHGILISKNNRGRFAQAVMRINPDLPVVEESELTDEFGQASFLAHVHSYGHKYR